MILAREETYGKKTGTWSSSGHLNCLGHVSKALAAVLTSPQAIVEEMVGCKAVVREVRVAPCVECEECNSLLPSLEQPLLGSAVATAELQL